MYTLELWVQEPSVAPADTSGGITAGDWLGASVGVTSLVATVVLAFLVYRLQRRDSKADSAILEEREKRRLEAEEHEKRGQEKANRERELRAVRRERHREDYNLATDAILILEKAFKRPALSDIFTTKVLTKPQMEEAGVGKAIEMLERVGANVSSLKSDLDTLALSARLFATTPVWSDEEIEERIRIDKALKNNSGVEFRNNIYSTQALRVIMQREAAFRGIRAIASARAAIEREWGV